MEAYKKKIHWENSYRNRDNFVFEPNEEVVRFTSKYIRKRVGLEDFLDGKNYVKNGKILDLGCGIGRHIIYFNKMNLDAYGIDISKNAIKTAHLWAEKQKFASFNSKIIQGDVRKLPWENKFFNFAISVGVLDGMEFEIAREACIELSRVVKKNSLVYIDLICGEYLNEKRGYSGEEVVTTKHENMTIQSYFDSKKIERLINGFFSIESCMLIKREDLISDKFSSRYHIVLKNL